MKRPARTFVIEEDEHLENLRKIIKRDFFGSSTAQQEAETIKMNLDGYLSNYKSNENQFFSQMVQLNNEQWKEKHWWIDKQDKMLMLADSEKFKALPYHNMLEKSSQVNGINTSIVKQDGKNSFFFNRDKNFGSLQSSQHQGSKRVVYNNCKLENDISKVRKELQVKQQEVSPLRDPWEVQSNKEEKHKGNVSPVQEQADGHLMTWGQIEATPMRIAGPEFRIPETPERETLLYSINSKIKKDKAQAVKKSEHAMKILGSLTPSLNFSRNRMISSMRRHESVKRESKLEKKSDLSGLLDIKK